MVVEDGTRVVRVFVSSPVDVAPERGRVQAVAAKLNRDYDGLVRFDTVLWEDHFYKADRSFQPQIPEAVACDILVSIFWTRVGTALPTEFARMADGKPYPSGTAYELLTALEASKAKGLPDVYVFRKTADAVLPTADLDRRRQAQIQLDALEVFWAEWFKSEHGHFKAAFQSFATTDEFERQVELLLRQWLQSHGLLGPRLKWPKEKGSPFRGLAPFEAEHAAVFFGRDRAIDEARRRLVAAADNGTPFLLIVGASGSGKSSLARAGLIPRLTTPGVVDTVDVWRVGWMKPSEGQAGPTASLAASLFAAVPELTQSDFPSAEIFADNLRRGGAAAVRPIIGALGRIGEAAQRQRQAEQPLRAVLVLLIDQLEELFAQAIGDGERSAFAEVIKQILASGQVWCIATLRADLYELVLKEPVLKSIKEAGASLDLGPPGAAELAEIVRAPAAAAGLTFENLADEGPLDERLLADAKTADSLPLLQFTLRQLYERRATVDGEPCLTHAAYDELGGLRGAIAAEAERAVAGLPAGTLDALPRLLRQLAEPAHDGTMLTLREVARSRFPAVSPEAALIDALLAARIIVANTDAGGQPTLRLAHDAVLVSWPKAAAAAQASREFYRVRAEVEDAMRRWQERGKPADRLVQPGVPLAEAEKLVADFGRELPPELTGFVAASRHRARSRQRLVATAAVFFFALALAATGASIYAYNEQQQAVRERQRAEASLAAATATANGLVFDLAQRFRHLIGIPAELIKDILDRALALQDELTKSGDVTPDLQHSEASALTETAESLLAIGDTAGALAAAERAREIDQSLVAADPNNVDWQRALSVSDEKVGDVLVARGDLAGALKAYRDDLAIATRLAQAYPSNALLQRDVSVADDKIGNVLMAQGDLPGALQAYQDGLAIAQKLAQARPDDAAAQRDLSVSYIKVGDVQVAQGDLAAALQAYRASLTIRQKIANDNSGDAGLQRDLAVSYGRVGDVEMTQNDLADALTSFRSAIAILERLVRSDAGNTSWQRDLSVLYERIGDVEEAQGDLTAALKSYQDCVAIRERLAKLDAGNAEWQTDIAAAYGKVGDVQMAQGDLTGALKSYRAGLAIFQRLAATDPTDATWQRDLAVTLNKVGGVQLAQGDAAGALQSYRDALAIARKLATSAPDNAQWQRDFEVCLNLVGDAVAAQGDLPNALASYREALAIAQRLAAADPANSEWQHDLSVSYEKIGNVQIAQGDLPGALQSYQSALAIVERLAAADAANTAWQRSLAVAHEKIGDLQWAQRNLAAALDSYQAALAIWQTLANADPRNAQVKRSLSVVYNKVGDVKAAQRDLPGALGAFQASLAIIEPLAKSDPANTGWQRDLSITHNKLGDVQMAQGDLPAALASYQAGLEAIAAIVKINPDNASWQRDLAVSYGKLAGVYRRMGDNAQALDALQKGEAVIARLASMAPDNPGWKRDLAWFTAQIAQLTATPAPAQ